MAALTLICRLADGLPLVQSTDAALLSAAAQQADTFTRQARAIVATLAGQRQGEARATVEAGGHSFCYYVSADDNLVLLAGVADKSYPKQLVFGYLAELRAAFVEELRAGDAAAPAASAASSSSSSSSSSASVSASAPAAGGGGGGGLRGLDTVDKPFAFMRFERVLQRLRKEYADPASRTGAQRLRDDLAGIQTVMRRNIQEVLERGEKLEHVSKISSKLVGDSKRFRWGAKKLNLLDAYAKFAPWAVGATVVLALVLWRFVF